MLSLDTPRGSHMTTTSADIATKPFHDLAATLRGDLIRPGDPGYDEARAVYNAMVNKHPAAIARCRDTADVITCVRFAREHGLEVAVRGGGHSAAGLGVADGALVIDLSLLRSTTVSPGGSHRPRRRRMHLGRHRPCDGGVRHGHPVGVHRLHRRGRPDARRRHRLPVPPLRPHRGQPAVRRRRARRRHLRHRQRGLAPRPVLGAARRRRELRHRHLVHLPLPRHRRARHHHRRPGSVRSRPTLPG